LSGADRENPPRSIRCRRAIFTTVHSYTSQHRLADVPAQEKRRGRAAAENIIPQVSRSPGMVVEAIPELAGKLTGYAMNVPVRNGSLVDLTCWFEKKVTKTAINEVSARPPRPSWRKIVRSATHRVDRRGPESPLGRLRLAGDDGDG
jgi:glyceraldehyde-3-phosphate dehydrogenase/erythrose-4-phosphate dehydrogenase